MNKISIAISLAALLMYGCGDKEQNENTKTQNTDKSIASEVSKSIYGTSTEQHAQAKAPADSDVQLNTPHIANVLETINSGGYTYAKVDEKGNIYWIAGPQSNISVGSSISFLEQMVMKDFTSKSLNKTFDQLVFVSAIISTDGSGKKTAAANTKTLSDAHKNCDCSDESKTTSNPHAQSAYGSKTATTAEAINVSKNKNGYSVEELHTKKADLNSKNIKVNAKVVKVSKNIMGKDWIHLQDGTGSAGTNDIIATSKNSTVKVGDIVTAEGTVKTNVDLGYGYKFSIIIEQAKLTAM